MTDGYLPQEEWFCNTRRLLEQLRGSGAEILICTKSDLVVRDIDLLRELGKVTVSWSVNTLDEGFRAEPGHPVIVDYFYHEEIRGSDNTGRRRRGK